MIYLDNSATTRPLTEAAEAVYKMMTDNFGNPSSFHRVGLDANAAVREAREAIAASLSAEPEELVFTSGGTEANNLAIFGAAAANRRRGNRIVTTAIEHESVLEAVKVLEQQGYEVIRLLPDSTGCITEQQLTEAITPDTVLVTVMYVNNEVGSVLPVQAIRKAVNRVGAPALVHLDCVQAYGKIPVKPKKLGADLVTVTAHKIHGPKGVGALYIKKGTRLVPRQYGGAQEQKIRPGTEAAPLIAGFGKAAALLPDERETAAAMRALNTYAREQLCAINGVKLNSGDAASDYIINLFVPTFMTSQTVVQHLSAQYGICLSSGSACAKGKKSHVLTAMRLPDRVIEHSVRISFSRFTTTAEIDALVAALRETVEKYPL
ncbi:MAG: cysteine desulfurase [Eubacterium sp.]|nr:cysteine desulfurase [Eubacterium sp.]